MVTKNSTTITLTGTEQTVQFDRNYNYFWVQNLGDSDVFVSMDSGIVEGADGVIMVPAGGSCCTMHGYPADKLYLLGSGRVQVMGTGSAFNPFKTSWKGGVDGTLSKAGYAADAKATGDNIAAINSNISSLGARVDNIATLPEGSTTGDAELIDMRLGADGNTYPNAGTAVRTQISELKQDLTNLYRIKTVTGKSLLLTDTIEGTLPISSVIDPTSTVYFLGSNIFAGIAGINHICGLGSIITVSSIDGNTIQDAILYTVTGEGTVIDFYTLTGYESRTIQTESNAYFFYIMGNSVSNIYVNLGAKKQPYEAYIEPIYEQGCVNSLPFNDRTSIISSNSDITVTYFCKDIPSVVHVGKGNDFMFNSLTDAITYCNAEGIKKIIVHEGLYDIIAEYGGVSAIDATNGDYVGLKPWDMELEFLTGSVVLCNYTGNNENVMKYFSAFNPKNTTFIGLNLRASKCRYAIHDENYSETESYKNIYENCYIYFDNHENAYWTTDQCIGGGLGNKATIIIDSCEFEPYSEQTVIVSYHPCVKNVELNEGTVIIKNSYIHKKGTLRLISVGLGTNKIKCLCDSNSFGDDIFMQSDNTYGEPALQWNLLEWNNTIRKTN